MTDGTHGASMRAERRRAYPFTRTLKVKLRDTSPATRT